MVTDRKWLSGHLLTYRLSYPNLEMLLHLKKRDNFRVYLEHVPPAFLTK